MAKNNGVKTNGAAHKSEASALLQAEATEETRAAALALERARRLAHDASAPDEEPETPVPSRLDVILETIADQGKFEVFRQVGGGNKSKVGIYPINEWPERMETVASTYKGGTFTIIFKDAGGRIRGQETQTFDPVAYSAGSAPAPEGRGADVVDRLLERMESRDEASRREMATLQAENSKMMLEMMKLIATRPAAEAAPQTSLPELIKLVRDLTPPPVDPLASLKGTVEMISMLKDGAADQAPTSPWMVALEKGLELLSPLVTVLAQKASSSGRPERPARLSPGAGADGRRIPPTAGVVADPAKTPLLENPTPAAPEPEPVPEPFKEDPQMKEYAGRLLQAAIGQVRPSIVAQLVVDAVTQETVDEFEAMTENEKLLDILIAHEPRLVAHTTWLKSVLTEMKEKFDEAWPSENEPEVAAVVDAAPVIPAPDAPAPAPAPATPAPVSDAPAPATDAPQEAAHA